MPERKRKSEGESRTVSAGGSRAFWSGVITFGLVSVPVELWPAVRASRPSLRIVDEEGQPLSRRWFCSKEGEAITRDDIVRGYEVDKDTFVPVTDEELEAIAPELSREIDLRRFVDARSIPPLYFERSWFLTPAPAASKAYRLLAATMESSDKAGIATFVMRGKEYLIAVLAEKGILRAETLRFAEEVRSAEDVGIPASTKVPPKSVQAMARKIANLIKKDISLRELEDEEADSLVRLVERKRKQSRDVKKSSPLAEEEVENDEAPLDLMEILKKSLGTKETSKKVPTTSPKKRAARVGAATRKPRGPRKASSGRSPTRLDRLSKESLYAKAQALDIPGRSRMSKLDLAEAIAEQSP